MGLQVFGPAPRFSRPLVLKPLRKAGGERRGAVDQLAAPEARLVGCQGLGSAVLKPLR